MDVNGIGAVLNSYQQAKNQGIAPKAAEPAENTQLLSPALETEGAVYEKSETVNSGDYSAKVSAMLAESQQKIAEFQNMFARYLGGQASNYDISTWSKANMEAAFKNATPEDVAAAQAAISEGGYYSVDAVATRIMDMAMALSGGDPSKIQLLRDAVDKGFSQAGQIYGAALPSICQDTYGEIMDRFDAWEQEAAAPEGEAAAE